jgi:chemotaxis protein methyltransferase CheR
MQQYIYERSGIVLDADKHYLLESRLLPILRQGQLETLDALCHHLRTERHSVLTRQVVDAMTTNETLFFRDPPMFDVLRARILPALLDRRKGRRRLRIWSAASSSGQEAYSLAMLLLEMRIDPRELEIFATDLSEKMLEKARDGRYVQFEVNRGLPASCLVRYFTREGLDWRIREHVRRMVRFERFDLRGNMASLGSFDLVLCRNVLIYFDQETREAIFDSIGKILHPGGVLLLGGAESMNVLRNGFERRQVELTSYYCVGESETCD